VLYSHQLQGALCKNLGVAFPQGNKGT
jgi:hypothetical protein